MTIWGVDGGCGDGRRIKETNPKGIYTTYIYDGFGRLISKTEDPCNIDRTTGYVYDRLGRLVCQIGNDGTNAQSTDYDYNKLGQAILVTYPDNGTVSYTYGDPNSNGKPTQRIDQRGITTVYSYDRLGHLLSKQNDDDTPIVESYQYDVRGLMVKAEKGTTADPDAVSANEFVYNYLGYLTQAKQTIGSDSTFITDYQRDQLGQAVQISYPDPCASGETYDFTYTSLGKVDTVSRDGDTLVTYDYAGSYVHQKYYNDPCVTRQITYDSFGRVSRVHSYDSDACDVIDFTYTYDAAGNITDQLFAHRTSDPCNLYAYDTLDRLTQAVYLGDPCDEEFTYDDLGNRLTLKNRDGDEVMYAHNNVNEYTTIGGNSLTHDNAGNMTECNLDYTYEYDYENRLTSIEDDQQNLVAEYTYDAFGRRIEKIAGGVTTRYYYDGWRFIEC